MLRIGNIVALLLMSLIVTCCEPSPSVDIYTSDTESGSDSSEEEGEEEESENEESESGESDSSSGDTSGNSEDLSGATIATLKSCYSGATSRITTSFSIKGVVVANDLKGEFEDVIVVDDGEDAIQISVVNDPLYYNYPLGTTVICQCDDLYIGSDYSVLRLGSAPGTSSDEVVSALEDNMLSKITFSSEAMTYAPTLVTVDDLTTRMISRYIRLEYLCFETTGSNFCDVNTETGRNVSTSHTLMDRWGNKLRLYVPYTAEYADMATPSGWFNMNAILEPKVDGQYTLRQINYGIDLCD